MRPSEQLAWEGKVLSINSAAAPAAYERGGKCKVTTHTSLSSQGEGEPRRPRLPCPSGRNRGGTTADLVDKGAAVPRFGFRAAPVSRRSAEGSSEPPPSSASPAWPPPQPLPPSTWPPPPGVLTSWAAFYYDYQSKEQGGRLCREECADASSHALRPPIYTTGAVKEESMKR